MKKILKILIMPLISLCFVLCLCLTNKVEASSVVDEFTPFEIGMTFPVGYELTIDNSNGVVPSKIYGFSVQHPEEADIFFHFYYYINSDGLFVSKDDVLYGDDVGSFALIGYSFNPDEGDYVRVAPENAELELFEISDSSGSGLLGIKNEIVAPNSIYQGIYDLLGDLIYGTTENLTDTQNGTLVFFSQLIVIFCLLLPFILVFMVIRLLFK